MFNDRYDEIDRYREKMFVRYEKHGEFRCGIITGIVKSDFFRDRLLVRRFDRLYPYHQDTDDVFPESCIVMPISKHDIMEYMDGISSRLEDEICVGGLKGAINARKRHHLDGVIDLFRHTSDLWLSDLYIKYHMEPSPPMTGLYVLMGIYSGQGRSEHLQGLKIDPRLSEEIVSKLMIEAYPDGFGAIPKEVNWTPATSHGDLVGYLTYEVPENYKTFVHDPKKLAIIENK